jgi:zinc protease
MKILLALVLFSTALASCSKEKSMASDTAPRALPNLPPARPGADIKTVLLSSPRKPVVVFRALFLSGSISDPRGKEGLTALTATVMAKGGTQALTSAELLDRLFPMAAELDVQVEKEMTVFVGRVHRDHLSEFLPIFLDVLLRPRWDPKELERLRADAVNDIEKRLRTSDDENLGKEALQGLLYEGHPYQHFTGGTVQGLKAITLDDLKAHARNVFTRARLLLGLAGGADAALEQRLREGLAALPAGVGGRPPLPPPPETKTRVLLVEKEAVATAISIGHPLALRRTDPEFPAAFVGNSAFGEHRQVGGRLFDELRAKRGLNYGDYSYVEHFVQDGWGTYPLPNVARRQQYFSIWIRPVEHAHRMFALRAALYMLDKLLREGLTQEELDKTRGFLQGYTRMWEQTDNRRLGFALDDQFHGSPPFLARLREAMPRLTLDEVNAALRKHIDPARLKIVMVTKGAKEVRDLLLSGKPTPIEYKTPRDKKVLEEDRKIEAFPIPLKPEEVRVVSAGELFER